MINTFCLGVCVCVCAFLGEIILETFGFNTTMCCLVAVSWRSCLFEEVIEDVSCEKQVPTIWSRGSIWLKVSFQYKIHLFPQATTRRLTNFDMFCVCGMGSNPNLFPIRRAWRRFIDKPVASSDTTPPIGSMYVIFTYIYHKNQPNVGKYTIHESYGPCFTMAFLSFDFTSGPTM